MDGRKTYVWAVLIAALSAAAAVGGVLLEQGEALAIPVQYLGIIGAVVAAITAYIRKITPAPTMGGPATAIMVGLFAALSVFVAGLGNAPGTEPVTPGQEANVPVPTNAPGVPVDAPDAVPAPGDAPDPELPASEEPGPLVSVLRLTVGARPGSDPRSDAPSQPADPPFYALTA